MIYILYVWLIMGMVNHFFLKECSFMNYWMKRRGIWPAGLLREPT